MDIHRHHARPGLLGERAVANVHVDERQSRHFDDHIHFEMVRPSQNWLFGLLLTQVAVLGISPVAVSGFPSVMFNILGARASAVEERKRFVIVLVALSIASVMSMLILQHINVRPLLNVPRGLNSQIGNLIRELYKIAMILGLRTFCPQYD